MKREREREKKERRGEERGKGEKYYMQGEKTGTSACEKMVVLHLSGLKVTISVVGASFKRARPNNWHTLRLLKSHSLLA